MEIRSKDHKSETRYRWKKKGLLASPDEFNKYYELFIKSKQCSLCNNNFKPFKDRYLKILNNIPNYIFCRECNLSQIIFIKKTSIS
tara:strand:+ start:243 stop:500 length:258 start_codon:yes stop_codon:yes gene_type:complete